VRDGLLHVRVAAPPVEGGANEALLRIVAAELGIPRRDVRLVAGATSRVKVIAAVGVAQPSVATRWPGLGKPR
jgi:hypothetical protein